MSDCAGKKRVLFVCVENSNRSQMAEAFARIHGGDDVEAASAGSKPSGKVNPDLIPESRADDIASFDITRL
jgi:arsenate reductase